MGFEMLYAIAPAVTGPLSVKIIHYAAGLATFFDVFAARRLGSGSAARLAVFEDDRDAALQLAVSFRVAYVDFAACWLSVVAILLWLMWRVSGESRLLVCLALWAGFAGSFKTTALSLAVAWAPVLVWKRRRGIEVVTHRARRSRARRARGVAGVKRGRFAAGRSPETCVPAAFGRDSTRLWSGAIDYRFRPLHALLLGVASGARLNEVARKHIVLGTLALNATASAFFGWRLRSNVLRCLLAFSTIFMLISVAVAGMVISPHAGRDRRDAVGVRAAIHERALATIRCLIVSLIMAVALLIQLVRPSAIEPWPGAARIATGIATPAEQYAGNAFWQMWQFINTQTPQEARVLIVFFILAVRRVELAYARFGSIARAFTTDSHMQETVRLDEWPAFLASVERLGVTHVLVASRQSNVGRHGFTFPALANEYPFGRRLVVEQGEKLATFQTMELYRLAPRANGRRSARSRAARRKKRQPGSAARRTA